MKYHFIINPVAGKQDSSMDLAPAIYKAAEACGIPETEIAIQLTQRPDHARFLARQAAECGEPVQIYAVGGDGTFNEVLTGALSYKNAAVGVIPYGSGNDFLRSFGTKEEFRDLKDQFSGGTMEIDLIRTQRGYAACIASAGLDAKVAYGIPKYRHIPLCGGETAYKLSILEALIGKRTTELKINIDGTELERDCLLVAVCNGHAYGGGFLAAPESKLDDGILDVLIVRAMPLLRIAKVLPVYQAGKHFVNGQVVPELQDVVEYYPAKKVYIRPARANDTMIVNVDGECGPDEGLSAEVVPLMARIVLPGKVLARHQSEKV